MNRRERRVRIGKRRKQGEKIERLPGARHPFKRALELGKLIDEVMAKPLPPLAQQLELNALPPLSSRGHGGRHANRRQAGGRWMQDRSKYSPMEEDLKHFPTKANKALRAKLHIEPVRKVIPIQQAA